MSTGFEESLDMMNIPLRKKETSNWFYLINEKGTTKAVLSAHEASHGSKYFTEEPCFIHLQNYVSASPKYTPILLGSTNQQEV